ncbi:rubrerythrin [Geoanaerobacter pelophilus]|nr:rubrerythrin [Geoanaerobacter pelophilus]
MPFSIDAGMVEVLGVCEKAEFACAELYHLFADLFKDDREIFYLWLRTALEEENRARLFALMAKLRHDNIIASVVLEMEQAEDTLQHIRGLMAELKEKPPTLREALQIGMELETRLDRLMRQNVVKFADETYEKSFLAITNSKRLELLQEACQRLAVA